MRPYRPGGPDDDATDVLPSVAATRAFPGPGTGPGTAPLRDPWADAPGTGPGTAPLRDPWADAPGTAAPSPDAGAEHTHDPHEVTVQLDAVQLGDGLLRRAEGTPRRAPEGSDGPVFVDASGRRSRRFRRLGIAVGIACAVYAVVMVATLMSGNSNAPWLPVPGQQEGKPAGQVDTTPLPEEPVEPSATAGGTVPRATPSAGDTAAPAPGAEAPAAGTTADPAPPAGAADPEPTATRTTPRPGAGGATEPGPGDTPKAPDPGPVDPSPTDGGEPSPDPSPTTGGGDSAGTGGDPGTGTVPNGATDPSPVAAPFADAHPSPSPSPEYTL
ncbi:hypothetical protein ACLGIH_21220 [Streptomyces sp. HMX87]|uniref:hypothetical protein n=1 Tax=Streptomyces sp. HMX87 TaxID=3390849 RepID=UPI003A8A15F9